MVSYNHYASGAVGAFLYSCLAGIKASSPGYKTIKIKPLINKEIKYVKSSTLTPYGLVEVEYKIEDTFKINVKVPYRTTCELILPNGEIINLECGKHSFERKI